MERTYFAIDLKSFYASVECVERNLDPLSANLVVADQGRTEKTICLAITPSLKKYGLNGRCRLFEVLQKLKEIEDKTKKKQNIVIAKPRMALYLEYSARIYEIYLKYFSVSDIHVYSIDEVFIDTTSYLNYYKSDAVSLLKKVIKDVFSQTGITATAGIAPNLYLCKVAMDIVAKHVHPDTDGVRIAKLTVREYREKLWNHRPLTDFWRIGKGIKKRLEKIGIQTMGEIARKSIQNEEIFYRIFGIDAEILIDHAWGIEPCTIKDIKNYKSTSKSINHAQVLKCPYTYDKAKIVVREMAEVLAQELKIKSLASDFFILFVFYDHSSLSDSYDGVVESDFYGRTVPKPAHSFIRFDNPSSSLDKISKAFVSAFERITDCSLFVRRINVSANNLLVQNTEQPDLFSDTVKQKKEMVLQDTLLKIQSKFGKNALLKAADYEEGATLKEYNNRIGGHKA